MKKSLIGAVLAWLIVLWPAVTLAARSPIIEIEDKILDFGDLAVGTTAEGVFIVRNAGGAPLEIREVRPTCGCTVADFDRAVAPGEAGRIHTVLDTTGYRGPVSWALMVFTNDPATPQVNLTVRANVVSFVEVLPRPLVRVNVLQGDTVQEKVVLASGTGAPFRVVGVSGAGEHVQTAVRELLGDDRVANQKGSQWELSITITPGAPEGVLHRDLVVKTDLPKAPEVNVSLSGVIRPLVQTIPSEVSFRAAGGGPSVSRNLMIINNKPNHSMEILSAEVTNPVFSLRTGQMGTSQRFQIAVTLKGGVDPGTHRGTIVVTTSHPDRPRIEVPVQAVIQ